MEMEKKLLIETSSIMNKTNRQFYTRRRKSINNKQLPQIEKTLTFLMNQSRKEDRKIKENLKTQTIQIQQRETLKMWETTVIKQKINILLQKLNKGWQALLKAFDQYIQCPNYNKYEQFQLAFYERFHDLAMIYFQQKKNQSNNKKPIKKNPNNSNNSHSNAVVLENIKLSKQNEILRHELHKFTKSSTENSIDRNQVEQIEEEERNTKMLLQRKLSTKIQENQMMAKQLQFLKQEVHMMRDDKKNLQGRISELKLKNENLCAQIISIQFKNVNSGQTSEKNQMISLMQRQEILSYQREVKDQRKIYSNLQRKYSTLLNKFKKAKTDNNCKIAILYSRQMQFFPQQMEAFEDVRTKGIKFIHKLHSEYQSIREKKKEKKQQSPIYQQYLGNKETINNKEGIKKLSKSSHYYYQPTFYNMVADDISFYGIDQNNYEHFNNKIKLNFLGTIRGILDCKYNQMTMYKDFRQISSFPAFVYSWLNTFELNSSKKISSIEKTSFYSNRQTISTFYVNLMSEKLNSSWEVITFREFLLETFRIDELYYYLGLRFYLLSGNMTTCLDSQFEQIYYIDYTKAIELIHRFVREQDFQYLKVLEEFIKRGIIYFRKKSFIDMHYLLRIMIEYYQYTKQRLFEKVDTTIDAITQKNKINIDFSDFMKIVDYHFEYMSLTQKIEFYRRCYCVGKGHINTEILFTVLNSENILLGWIPKVLLTHEILIQDAIGHYNDQSSFNILPNLDYLNINEQKYRYIYNAQIKREISRLGVEHCYFYVSQNTQLNNQSIHDRLEDCFELCMFIFKRMYRSGCSELEEIGEPLNTIIQFLWKFSKETMQRNEIKEVMLDFKYEGACKKIVKFYQKKKQQMVRSVMYAYSNNSQRIQQEQKNQLLRTEFLNIISQMKNKKESHKLLE